VLEVTSDIEKALSHDAVLYFTAPWCGPCANLKPQVVRAGTIDNDNTYYIINVDEIDKKYLDEFTISSVPHIYIIKDREIVREIKSRKAKQIVEEVNNV